MNRSSFPGAQALRNKSLLRAEGAESPSRRGFSLDISERRLLLGWVDMGLLSIALLLTLQGRSTIVLTAPERALGPLWSTVLWFGVLGALWFSWAFVFGCYDLGRAARTVPALTCCAAAALATSFSFYLLPYVTPELPLSRAYILALPALIFVLLAVWRLIYIAVLVRPRFYRSGIVIGAGWAGRELATTLAEMERASTEARRKHSKGEVSSVSAEAGATGVSEANAAAMTSVTVATSTEPQESLDAGIPNLGYRIVGFVDDDPSKQECIVSDVPVLGTRHELVELARKLHPHELVVAITHPETIHAELFDAILECREMGIAVTPMSGLYEQLTGRVPIEHAGRALWVVMPLRQSATHRFYLIWQRLFDITVGLIGCAGLAVVIPCVWLANRVSCPGALFYAQERTGMGGKPFKILKFRSMRPDAEKFSGAVWAEENDPRITPVGNFLRKTRLDEVPQFWNVLKGEMSMIGPRPERPHFIDQLAQEIPFYRARHAVKPGLTGWAQIRYRYGASVQDALIKLQYDLFYIKHRNMLLDLEIVVRTVPIVLGFKGR